MIGIPIINSLTRVEWSGVIYTHCRVSGSTRRERGAGRALPSRPDEYCEKLLAGPRRIHALQCEKLVSTLKTIIIAWCGTFEWQRLKTGWSGMRRHCYQDRPSTYSVSAVLPRGLAYTLARSVRSTFSTILIAHLSWYIRCDTSDMIVAALQT